MISEVSNDDDKHKSDSDDKKEKKSDKAIDDIPYQTTRQRTIARIYEGSDAPHTRDILDISTTIASLSQAKMLTQYVQR